MVIVAIRHDRHYAVLSVHINHDGLRRCPECAKLLAADAEVVVLDDEDSGVLWGFVASVAASSFHRDETE